MCSFKNGIIEWGQCFPMKTQFFQDCGQTVWHMMVKGDPWDRASPPLYLVLNFGSYLLACLQILNYKGQPTSPNTST